MLFVIPAQAGIHFFAMDTCFRRYDTVCQQQELNKGIDLYSSLQLTYLASLCLDLYICSGSMRDIYHLVIANSFLSAEGGTLPPDTDRGDTKYYSLKNPNFER